MVHVYTIAGAKGGVGKTTTSINLGATLAASGHETVTLELDLAMANLVDFLDVEVDVAAEPTFHDVLAGETAVEDATYETENGLAVVPSGTDLAGYADTDLDRLESVLETLKWRYDVVLLDTPAGLSEETVRPMRLADETILVSTPRVSAVRNTRNTYQLAERVDTDVYGLVLTKSGTGGSPGADRIAEFLGVELLGHVPEDDAVPHAQDRGEPVIAAAPQSGAAIAYRKIGRQLVERTAESEPERNRSSDDRERLTVGRQMDGHRVSGDGSTLQRNGPVGIREQASDTGTTDSESESTGTTVGGIDTDGSDRADPDTDPGDTGESRATAAEEDGTAASTEPVDDQSIGARIRSLFGL